jgi:hypothetical protein
MGARYEWKSPCESRARRPCHDCFRQEPWHCCGNLGNANANHGREDRATNASGRSRGIVAGIYEARRRITGGKLVPRWFQRSAIGSNRTSDSERWAAPLRIRSIIGGGVHAGRRVDRFRGHQLGRWFGGHHSDWHGGIQRVDSHGILEHC